MAWVRYAEGRPGAGFFGAAQMALGFSLLFQTEVWVLATCVAPPSEGKLAADSTGVSSASAGLFLAGRATATMVANPLACLCSGSVGRWF